MTDSTVQVGIPAKNAVALTSSLIQLEALNRETERVTQQRDAAREQLEEMVTTLSTKIAPENTIYKGLNLEEAVMIFEQAPAEAQEGDSPDSPEDLITV